MYFNKMSMVMLFVMITLAASGCGQIEVGIETQASPAATAEGDKTPPSDTGVTVKDPSASATPQPDPSIAAYWSEAIDERTGIRFAVPCFWEVQIPELDPSGLGDFFVRNYDEEFVLSHPRGYIWGTGAMKIDFSYIQLSSYGLPSDASPSELAIVLGGDLSELVGTDEVTINGQPATLATTRFTENLSTSQYYLIKLDADLYLLFAAAPDGALESADVQGILHSIALTDAASVQIPSVLPSPAPEGFSAPCLKDLYAPSDTEPLADDMPCADAEAGTAEGLSCEIQQALLARDMAAVRSLMRDPFAIGYWQSEGVSRSPAEASDELDRYRLPADTSGLTFTTDRSQFPPLFGMPPDAMFGVDMALVIYSEGWGSDGLGAALLYLAQKASGSYSWYGMVIAGTHFDK